MILEPLKKFQSDNRYFRCGGYCIIILRIFFCLIYMGKFSRANNNYKNKTARVNCVWVLTQYMHIIHILYLTTRVVKKYRDTTRTVQRVGGSAGWGPGGNTSFPEFLNRFRDRCGLGKMVPRNSCAGIDNIYYMQIVNLAARVLHTHRNRARKIRSGRISRMSNRPTTVTFLYRRLTSKYTMKTHTHLYTQIYLYMIITIQQNSFQDLYIYKAYTVRRNSRLNQINLATVPETILYRKSRVEFT